MAEMISFSSWSSALRAARISWSRATVASSMWVSSPRCAMLVSAYQSPAEPLNPDHGCAADVPVKHLGSDLAGLHLEEVCRILTGDGKHLLPGEARCVDGARGHPGRHRPR